MQFLSDPAMGQKADICRSARHWVMNWPSAAAHTTQELFEGGNVKKLTFLKILKAKRQKKTPQKNHQIMVHLMQE